MIGENYMKQIILSLKYWVNNNFALKEDLTNFSQEELTSEDVLNLFFDLGIIDPITDEEGFILTENNDTLLVF